MTELQYSHKVFAITGAASGIGLATAHLLAGRGAALSLADIQPQALAAAQEEILAQTPLARLRIWVVDVRDSTAVSTWINGTVAHFGRLDGAANIAAVVPPSMGTDAGLLENVHAADWDRCIGVNLTGVMHCVKFQLRVMSRNASIVNISSIAGLIGREKNGVYAASKHGVIGLTRSAAKEVGKRGVRVNAVCPGRINTGLALLAEQTARLNGTEAEYDKETMTDIALKRKGEPAEVSKAIAFLLSDESSYITGAVISVDGGWNC